MDNSLIFDNQPFKVVFINAYSDDVARQAAGFIADKAVGPLAVDSFNFELRERCHAAFKLFTEERLPAAANYFDANLDQPTDFFAGNTPNQMYDRFSTFILETHGPEVLGQWVVERANYYRQQQRKLPPEQRVKGIILFDTATDESMERVAKSFGLDNCLELSIVDAPRPFGYGTIDDVEIRTVVDPKTTQEELGEAIRLVAPTLFIEIAKSFEV